MNICWRYVPPVLLGQGKRTDRAWSRKPTSKSKPCHRGSNDGRPFRLRRVRKCQRRIFYPAKRRQGLYDFDGLLLQTVGDGCSAFDQCGILYGHIIHVADGGIHLGDTGTLFARDAEAISPMTLRTFCTSTDDVAHGVAGGSSQ